MRHAFTAALAALGLAAAARARPGEIPQAVARSAVAAADHVPAPDGPQPSAITEETERIASWLERPGVRLIEIDGEVIGGSDDLEAWLASHPS